MCSNLSHLISLLLNGYREVIRGSVLQQPDSEFNDPTRKCVEKYLIKWLHASYLHVSWETEKDIIDLVGSIAKVRHQFLCEIYNRAIS